MGKLCLKNAEECGYEGPAMSCCDQTLIDEYEIDNNVLTDEQNDVVSNVKVLVDEFDS